MHGTRLTAKVLFTFALLLPVVVSSSDCVRNNYALENGCAFVARPGIDPAIPEGLGVNIHFVEPRPGEIKMIAAAGFRWVRMDFKWDATERERGSYDFSSYDRLLEALQAYKIDALFILDYGNPLYDNGAPPRTRATREAFAQWAVAAAKHFSGRGVVWELYNEPNHQIFWPPRPNAGEYVQLALTVGRAFRTLAPNEKLIGPAISEFDFPFLKECFKAGLLDYWTAVSVHPYLRSDPELVAGEYCRLRQMIASYARGRVIPIISSEWGYSSVWRGMNEDKQGVLLARQALINAANGISISIWYDWRDDGTDPNESEHHFGLVRYSYQSERDQVYEPKPAYLAAKTLSEVFSGYKFEKRFQVGNDHDYVLVFAWGEEVRIAAWTTSTSPHAIIIPRDPGQFTVITHTGERRRPVLVGRDGLSIDVSSAPIYLTRLK